MFTRVSRGVVKSMFDETSLDRSLYSHATYPVIEFVKNPTEHGVHELEEIHAELQPKLPLDIQIEILKYDLESFVMYCTANPSFEAKDLLSKYFLHMYNAELTLSPWESLLEYYKTFKLSTVFVTSGTKVVPSYPNAKELFCESPNTVEEFGQYKNLEVLHCEGSMAKSLPSYKNLKILHINDSPNLENLGSYPKLEVFNCSNCTSLEQVPESNSLKELYCSGSKITSLGTHYPELTRLYCRNNRIQDLTGEYPNLTSLHSSGNPIVNWGNFPKLITFD